MVTVRYVMYSVCRLRRRCSKCSCQKQIWLNRQWPDHDDIHEVVWETNVEFAERFDQNC